MAVKRDWDVLSEEKRNEAVKSIINFFEVERDERIGMIAAGDLLDFFLQNIGIDLYNKGVSDSIDFLRIRFQDIEMDMESVLLKM